MSSSNDIFSNASGMSLSHASFSNVGRDQLHNDQRVYGSRNEYYSGGEQHNYTGSGQFINHGRSQNVNTGAGNFMVHEHGAASSAQTANPRSPARAIEGIQLFNRQVTERENPFRSGQLRIRSDTEILEWARTIDENQLTRLTQEGKVEVSLRDMQRATYSPECDLSLKYSILKSMISLSEASGCCIQPHYNPKVQKIGEHPVNPNGTFVDVWKGRIGDGSEIMALKVVKQTYVSEVSEELKTHMRNVIGWRMLDHPNVVPFIGSFYFGANPREMCLVSPWMESNLADYLAKNHCQSLERFSLAWDVACGVEYLHRSNVTHGNLKGRNILIRTEGESSRALIADFGLYMLYPRSMSGHIRPTPWCAPEVLRGGSLTQKSDIYAYGILCYEIFSGSVPFRNLNEDPDALYQAIAVQRQRPERPPEMDDPVLWEVLEQCWNQEPTLRPAAFDVVKNLGNMVSLFSQHSKKDLENSLLRKLAGDPRIDIDEIQRRGLLTFGAVVDRTNPEITGYFRSTPQPVWYCTSIDPLVKATYSESVPTRVDLRLGKEIGKEPILVKLQFGLGLSSGDRQKLRNAFLSQALHFFPDPAQWDDVVLFDNIQFTLEYQISTSNTAKKCPTLMHIFIPPLSPAWIDNKHCICWPLTETLYYWSLDLDGQAPITTEDLRDYGIRVLSHSVNFEAVFNRTPYYEATLNHIQSLNYDPYSLEYAQGQGHELMVRPGGNQGQNLACQTPTELPTNPPPPPPGEDFDLHVHTTPTATLQHHPTDSWLRKLFRQVQSLARAVVICSLCKAESFGERLPVPQGDDGGRDQAH